MKNYYQILNIRRTANNDEIKKLYRQAALFWHPDKNKSTNAHEKFIEVNEAYNILIDVSKRRVYDHLYDSFYNVQQEINVFRETKKDYKTYEQWVKFERMKAEQLMKISSDKIITDTFYFIDKYGWLILLMLMGTSVLVALIIKK